MCALTTRAFLLAALLAAPLALRAQPPDAPVTPEQRTQIVAAIAERLRSGYVDEARGHALAQNLVAAYTAGAFGGAATVPALADTLTAFLRHHSRDRHLRVGRVRSGAPGATPGGEGPRPSGRIQTPNGVFDRDRPILRAEVLPGNVGLLAVGSFGWTAAGQAQVDSAAHALRGVSALILDVGHSPGGGPEAVIYLSSLLFDRPTHLVSTMQRGWAAPQERWTRADVPGPRFAGVPVVVLTSARTFSAAESFTFGLRTTGRARVVGERTGGGHFGAFVPLPAGLSLFLPMGRTYDPATGQGWEAEGLQPDVDVPYASALPAALALLRHQGLDVPAPADADAQQAVRDAEAALLAAYGRRDAGALDTLLAPGFSAAYPGGRSMTRAETLDMMRRMAGAPPARHWTEGTTVHLYGAAAVLTGTYLREMGGRTTRARYSDLWVRQGDRWRLAASRTFEDG
jgi:retinol-binding protein 3